MNASEHVSEASGKPQAAEGRDAKGRFAKGNAGGPGNPFARKVAELRKALVNFVTEDDMKHVAFILKEKAMGGNLEAIKLLFQYVLGKPAETVDPDRLDVDEWEKMQEKSRPAAEMQQVMGGLPAQTVCDLAKVAWPCAVDQAFRQPLLEGFRKMDEEDARRASETAGSGEPGRAPETAGVKPAARQEERPSANGSDGEQYEPWWWQELTRAAEAERMAREARERREEKPSTNGRNGKGGHEGGSRKKRGKSRGS